MAKAVLAPEATYKMNERSRVSVLALGSRVPSPWGLLFFFLNCD